LLSQPESPRTRAWHPRDDEVGPHLVMAPRSRPRAQRLVLLVEDLAWIDGEAADGVEEGGQLHVVPRRPPPPPPPRGRPAAGRGRARADPAPPGEGGPPAPRRGWKSRSAMPGVA